ncbi:EsV-1-200 [Ectocarpus siliculosus virus 1]|uniref:EsV-1-200 n=1 Tax=Ectocarpus siliculosus virus 1 (isolate New Zealand/Kaikoura/1988) TaxID=654926 RepID=Q8QN89_ESV1K|nr:EsV-1-200 [Ectocarpus siliculosus virus 1]AAK14614.1 EsV-1-200 [Ectocarpus siliculosus virus 1]
MDDIGKISLSSDFVKNSNLISANDDLRKDANEWLNNRNARFATRDMYKITDNDIAVMRGIAESGALNIEREIGGLYDPKRSFKPCDNLPSHPEEYMETTDLYKCGLSDLVLGSFEQVVIWWSSDLVRKAYDNSLIMWHTHPDQADIGLIHSPPSVLDFEFAVNACRHMMLNVDQFIVTKLGLWRLRVRVVDLITLSKQQEEDAIANFNFYAAFIQSDDEVAKTNRHVDASHRRDRMTPEQFVDMISRNVHWFTIQYYAFF